MPLRCIDARAPTNQKHNIAQNCPAIRHLACSSSLALLLTLFIANFHNNMRQGLLDAYWDVVREGLTFKEATDRRGVNRGTLKDANVIVPLKRPRGRPRKVAA